MATCFRKVWAACVRWLRPLDQSGGGDGPPADDHESTGAVYRSPSRRDDPGEGPLFVAVANFGGTREMPRTEGSRHFSHGTKVYVRHVLNGADRLQVIGRHRASKRLVAVIVRTALLTNARVKPVHSPTVQRLLTDPESSEHCTPWEWTDSRARAHGIVELINGG